MKLPDPPLLLITDRRVARQPIEVVADEAFRAGCRWLSLRDKDLPALERRGLLDRLTELGAAYDATVVCHGDLPPGRAPQGLHLGRSGDVRAARSALGPQALIGRSAHDLAEARTAAQAGADYVTYSPVFPSLSKPGHGPDGSGLGALSDVCAALDRPVLALGGVTAENARACVEAGASGLAVVGAVMAAEAPGRAAEALLRTFAKS